MNNNRTITVPHPKIRCIYKIIHFYKRQKKKPGSQMKNLHSFSSQDFHSYFEFPEFLSITRVKKKLSSVYHTGYIYIPGDIYIHIYIYIFIQIYHTGYILCRQLFTSLEFGTKKTQTFSNINMS